jgi:multiple sugar transport system permease protein
MPRSPQRSRLLGNVVYHVPRLAVAALFVIPFVWVLSASLRQTGLPPPRTIEWLPSPVEWSNYARVFRLVPLAGYIGNSLLVVGVAVPLTILTASWAGLAMAQMAKPARRLLVVLAVMLLMIPAAALWLTRFVIFKHLGLIDSMWALVAPAAMGSSPLFVLLYIGRSSGYRRPCTRLPASMVRPCCRSGAHRHRWPADTVAMVFSFVSAGATSSAAALSQVGEPLHAPRRLRPCNSWTRRIGPC